MDIYFGERHLHSLILWATYYLALLLIDFYFVNCLSVKHFLMWFIKYRIIIIIIYYIATIIIIITESDSHQFYHHQMKFI